MPGLTAHAAPASKTSGRLPPPTIWHAAGLLLLAVLAGLLYGPYLQNPLIFDDVNIFHSEVLTYAAIAPWELGIRGLPYFTLGWVETQIGGMPVHRSISLLLHILVAYNLFRLLEALLGAGEIPAAGNVHAAPRARSIALLVALLFVCHPVAVYGAGYLVQRTIVMATLFSLLCLRFLLAAFQQRSTGLAAVAAVWVSLAILSKEHAILAPVAALGLIFVAGRPWRECLKVAAVFFCLSLPAMGLALYVSMYSVGRAYEPGLKELEGEIYGLPAFSGSPEKWLFSIFNQVKLYFQYALQWLWPDPQRMSIDLRVDFLRGWTPAGAYLWMAAFAALPLTASWLAWSRPKGRLVAFALFFTATIVGVEFASVRFQEPYVLYRSYLWSIGYCVFFAALVWRLPHRLAITLMLLAVPLLFYQATGRLDSFRSKQALWEDAGAKLPRLEIGGSSRILFNRGNERFKAGDVAGAMGDINEAIRLNPPNGRYRLARATSWLKQGRPADALADIDAATPLLPGDANLLFVRYQTLQRLGRHGEAEASLAEAAKRGSYGARYELARRRSVDGTVTVNPN